jgi:ABC-type multidrug transport system ATPase subunit
MQNGTLVACAKRPCTETSSSTTMLFVSPLSRHDSVPARTTPLSLQGFCVGRLAPVDVEVVAGEVVVLAGDSDEGVAALLTGALGLVTPVAGRATLFGVDVAIADHDVLLAVRARAALATLHAPLLANLTVRDNLIVPLAMRSIDEQHARVQVEEILVELQLTETLGRRPHELSPRQHRELLLVRSLLLPADLYLWDEPPLSSRLLGRLPALVAAGKTAVLTTTSERLLRSLSTSFSSLRVVRLAAQGSVGVG